jgi:hypothetical protein
MKTIIMIFVSLLAVISPALAVISEQTAQEGFSLSFKLGQEYQKATFEAASPTAFNALVDQWNAFVQANFGAGSGLLMQKMTAATADLSKPYILGNNTTNNKGMVHAIDGGNGKYGPTYTTNDINLLPDYAIEKYHAQDQASDGAHYGDGYLGGV